uniref:C2H2-type domain-containing protein n=1 Tax=Heterorhabditis bacteriophora TaxID=37862 RepID=A0A1I7XEY8_HETBA
MLYFYYYSYLLTYRLKGNLKKHLKTHVSTKEELEEAWRPFARKLGLGADPRMWIEKIRRGEILPGATIQDKVNLFSVYFYLYYYFFSIRILTVNSIYLELIIYLKHLNTVMLDLYIFSVYEVLTSFYQFRFDCPLCKSMFLSRSECYDHLELEHPMARIERPLFCEVCLKTFADRKSLEQHESYHKRVHLMIEHNEIEIVDPEILLPETCDPPEDDHMQIHQSIVE